MLSITDKSAAFSYSTLSRSFAAALVVHLSLQNDENAECFMYNFWPTAELMVTRTTHRRRWKSRALMTSLEVYTWATQKSSRRNFFGETEIQETKNEWIKNVVNLVFYHHHHGCSLEQKNFGQNISLQ